MGIKKCDMCKLNKVMNQFLVNHRTNEHQSVCVNCQVKKIKELTKAKRHNVIKIIR